MKNFFGAESPLTKFLTWLVDMVVLGAVTVICCIPIFTVGASISAMYDVMIHRVLGTEGYLLGGFFKAFAKNFKKGTLIWLICAALIFLIWQNFVILFDNTIEVADGVKQVMFGVAILMSILFIFMFCYVFALQARFENTVLNTIKNAFFISIAQFPKSFIMTIVVVALGAVGYFYPLLIPIILLLYFSFVSYFFTRIIVKVFGLFGDEEARGEVKEEEFHVENENVEAVMESKKE